MVIYHWQHEAKNVYFEFGKNSLIKTHFLRLTIVIGSDKKTAMVSISVPVRFGLV